MYEVENAMRVAFFVHSFPSISETFILRQITGLLDQGHEVHIYSERRPEGNNGGPFHSELRSYDLAKRTT